MSNLFITLLNFSINASWLILAVLLLRLLLKKAPKWVSCVLWGLVAVRLVCPFSLKSVLSLIPSSQVIPQNFTMAKKPVINTGIAVINSAVNPIISESMAPAAGDSVNPLQVITAIASVIWITGMSIMIIYALISYIRLRKRVRTSIPAGKNVMTCDEVKTPFILGLIKPVIYVPSSVKGRSLEFVIAHETAHLKRHDHWWKPLGFALLAVYWFNPLCWIAYIMLCRDIESACDEKVIKEQDKDYIADYSQTLLDLSTPGKTVSACPLAFGETGVKGRVKGVLSYRKPAFWLVIVAVISCFAVGVCFLTDPVSASVNDDLAQFLQETVLEQNRSSRSNEYFCCCDIEILDVRTRGKTTEVYAMILYNEYSDADGQLQMESGSHGPAVIKAVKTDSGYELEEYWIPRDGTYYENDIRTRFPYTLQGKALDTQSYIEDQEMRCREKAEEYYYRNWQADGGSHAADELYTAETEYNTDWMNIENTRIYYYSGNRLEDKNLIDFSITLEPDGTFSYYETPISSFIGMGKYQIKDGILTLADDKLFTGRTDVFRFRIEGDRLYYVAEGSANFDFVKLEDGEEFILGVNPVGRWWEQIEEKTEEYPELYGKGHSVISILDESEDPDYNMNIYIPEGYYISYVYAAPIEYLSSRVIIPDEYYDSMDDGSGSAEVQVLWEDSMLAGMIDGIAASDADISFNADHEPAASEVPAFVKTDAEYIKTFPLGPESDGWYVIMLREFHDLEGTEENSIYWSFWYVKEDVNIYYMLSLAEKDFSQEKAEEIAGNVEFSQNKI